MTKKLKKQIKGFTLVELMVVMAIIAVLATLIIGAISIAHRTQVETVNRSNARTLATAFESYYAKNRQYPAAQSGVSFATAAAAVSGTVLSNSCGAESAVSPAVAKTTQGGQATWTTTTYTFTPFDYQCAASLGTNDVISTN